LRAPTVVRAHAICVSNGDAGHGFLYLGRMFRLTSIEQGISAFLLAAAAIAGCATGNQSDVFSAAAGSYGGASGTTGSGGMLAAAGGSTTTAQTASTTSTGAGGGLSGSGGGVGGAGGSTPTPCLHQADCAALTNACNTANCVNNFCMQVPVTDGTPCDDGLFCTTDDSCTGGTCGGIPMSCPTTNPCQNGTCDEATKSCTNAPGNDGAPCPTSDVCAPEGFCQNGTCGDGTPLDCSFLDQQCQVGTCNAQNGICAVEPAGNGTACDDGLFCTENDVCTNGTCMGTPLACPPGPTPCLVGVCNELDEACETGPGNDGAACISPSVCLTDAVCSNGTCGGGTPANDGGTCTNGNACETVDTCQAGVCSGTAITQCINGDGCCPPGCTFADDTDCPGPLFSQASYSASLTFQDQLSSTTMTMAWDGTSYWSCSGGNVSGARLAQYTPTGALIATYQPGIDFRSVFTMNGNSSTVYERGYDSNLIEIQQSPGFFAGGINLAGTLDPQSGVVLDAANQFVATTGGTVSIWSAAGAQVQTFTLNGFTPAEDVDPQNRGIVVAGGYYLTYYDGTLSAWDGTGTRQKTTVLVGAGTSEDSYYSLSYANGMVWIVDMAGSTWRGYNVGL
jgi:hypothetical protein